MDFISNPLFLYIQKFFENKLKCRKHMSEFNLILFWKCNDSSILLVNETFEESLGRSEFTNKV